ncbi:FAD-dependent oxidoreductase [Herbiconiux ginsengi]|uniref:2-polyprenyl-6-methoxyphenol hydroxylase n=1 Tax=Herbiconiux ginsengi TaxID=381665 RepID=A0A1H3TUW2_9MICO|nr:FAD-dependent oxidoreductase [Herbiconiux ginsengi]SDZ53828.1 2-polyprenyl-6-methoxyphenol hydroxylase [Herbiconiux ginsengi]
MKSSDPVDVLVIGGGPAGATVAAEAARAGASVIVAEKRTGDSPSRAGVIQPRVLELLDARGLMGRFRAAAAEWRPDFEVPIYMYAGLGGLRYDQLDSDFPYALILPQTTTEHLLRAWAVESGAEVRRGVRYAGHRAQGDLTAVDLVDEAGVTVTVETRYLVGADGARSHVRATAGIPFEGREITMTAMSVDADLSFPWAASMQMKRNEAGWILTYPFGVNTTRFIIVAEASRNVPTSVPVTEDEVRESLVAIFGSDLGFTTAHRMSRYGDAHKMVPRFREGNVFLVGEATRVHYPASGIGMNYCIQDAFNLGWKLGAVAVGAAPDSLLDTYQTERFPVLQKLMDDVDTQTSLHFDFSEGGLKLKDFLEQEIVPIPEVNAVLRDRLSGFGTRYPVVDGDHPAVGSRVGQIVLSGGGAYTQVAAESDFVFVEAPDSAVPRDLPSAFGYGTSTDLEGALGHADVVAALIRPDAYVAQAWTSAPTDAEIRTARERALGSSSAAVALEGAR